MTTTQLQLRQQGAVTSPAAIGDPFGALMVPARSTLDAVVQLKPALELYNELQKRAVIELDLTQAWRSVDEAKERLQVIPSLETLREAVQLFEDAHRVAAPSAWLHVAVGIMLDSMPNAGKVSASYRHGIVDSMLYDDEFAPGFSQPAVIRAIRHVRKAMKFVPAPAEFLEACKVQRRFFKETQLYTEILTSIRENAEAVVAEFNRKFGEDFGDEEVDIGPRQLEPDDRDFEYPF